MNKYNLDDINRIFNERVKIQYYEARLKAGVIAEWTFEYPNGNITAQCTGTWAMNPENNDFEIAKKVIEERIKGALWEIVGKYTLATGEML